MLLLLVTPIYFDKYNEQSRDKGMSLPQLSLVFFDKVVKMRIFTSKGGYLTESLDVTSRKKLGLGDESIRGAFNVDHLLLASDREIRNPYDVTFTKALLNKPIEDYIVIDIDLKFTREERSYWGRQRNVSRSLLKHLSKVKNKEDFETIFLSDTVESEYAQKHLEHLTHILVTPRLKEESTTIYTIK